MYIEHKDAAPIVAKAFPHYNGHRQINVLPLEQGVSVYNTYWDSGSRRKYVAINLETLDTISVPAVAPAQFGGPRDIPPITPAVLPPNCAVAVLNEGRYTHIELYVASANIPKFLPPVAELDRDVEIVLLATASLKASYGGIPNFRFTRAQEKYGITWAAWCKGKEDAIKAGYLNKAGAITANGRNAVASHPDRRNF